MNRYKFFVNIEKEEAWLNEMAKHGYALIGKSFGYQFRKAEPADTVIKIDYRTFKRRADFEDYVALFKDSGWEHVSGTRTSGAQYFKKTDAAGSGEIFSDSSSKASRYERMADMWLSIVFCLIPIISALVATNLVDLTAFLNPKSLYYTPGLWEKEGWSFWRAFLFETPFALQRGFLWMLLPVTLLLYLVCYIKARSQYRSTAGKE